MQRIDLHVHSRRYSDCAEFLAPEELGDAMSAVGLDGIVLTEHDTFWEPEQAILLQRQFPQKKLYFGIELSASDGHLVAIGLSELPLQHLGGSLLDLARAIGTLGGCAIWVHPFKNPVRWSVPPSTVHAVEIHSTVTLGRASERARGLAEQLRVPAVAGSDAHAIAHLGAAWVEFDQLPTSESELAAWLREGRARTGYRI